MLVGGTIYKLGPDGTQFASPVTVTIRYDQTQAPPWAIPSDFAIYRWNGTQWSKLTNITVDPAAHTVSGQTQLPAVTLDPAPGQINYQQRSVVFTADVAGHAANAFTYQWTTTGANGGLGVAFGNTMQYIGSVPILPPNVVDVVSVDVQGPITPNGPAVSLKTASANVTSDLNLTFTLTPFSTTANFEDVKTFQAAVRDRSGALYPGDVYYEWTATANAGNTSPAAGQQTKTSAATYTAFPAGQQVKNPVRGDKITVKIVEKQVIWTFTTSGKSSTHTDAPRPPCICVPSGPAHILLCSCTLTSTSPRRYSPRMRAPT